MGRRKPRASQHHKPPHSHASNEAADAEKTQPSGQQLYGQPGPRSSRASKTGERQDGSGQRTRQQTSYSDTSNHSPQRGTPYHQHHRRGSRKSMHSNVRNRTYGNSQELTAAETVGRGKRHEGSSHSRPYQNQSLGGRGYHDNEQEEQTAQQAWGHPRRHHDGSYYRCKKVHQQRSDQGAHRKSWTKTKCSRQDVSQPGGSTSTDESAASGAQDDLEIPGFYYDREKKKYFRILPGQNNTIAKVVTRESIKIQATEEYRQQKLREFALKTIQMECPYDFSKKRKRCYNSKNIAELASCVQIGDLSANRTVTYKHKVVNHIFRNLRSTCKRKVFEEVRTPYEKFEHMLQMMPSLDMSQGRLLCMWSLVDLIVQRVQILQVNDLRKRYCNHDNSSTQINVEPVGTVLLQSFSKITNMCWATMPDTGTAQSPVLYTTTCFLGNNPSLASLRRLDCAGHDSQLISEFSLGKKATWTCAWSPCSSKFSVGSEGSGLLIDVATRKMWELYTRKADVFTQAFSYDGNTLYSGTRKGQVLTHDLRSASTYYVSSLHHRSSVCHLHLLSSGNHLLATDFSGRLSQWDLRMQRVVLQYLGHSNEYTRIPFKVDQNESIVYAAGQDCYTRLWDLRTAELLTSIPPPHHVSRDTIPSVCLYSTPGGPVDHPGLLMGSQDELHFYSA